MSETFTVIKQMTFENGRFIARTAKSGTIQIELKERSKIVDVPVDSIVLSSKDNVSICGPAPLTSCIELATAVIEGEPSATTDLRTLYMIAAALLAVVDDVTILADMRARVFAPSESAGRPDALT